MKPLMLPTILFTLITSSIVLLGCGGSSSNAYNDDGTTELSDDEISGLLFMREEEELARDLYIDIYEATGSRLTTFQNISVKAETQHAEAIRVLLERYGIDDPSTGVHNTYRDPDLQDLYDQLFNIAIGSDDLATLRVGALVEETDIRDINNYKAMVSAEKTNIIDTYDRLLCGSRNHLRAFAGQIENLTGSAYVTQVPALDAEVQEILNSSKERCGRN